MELHSWFEMRWKVGTLLIGSQLRGFMIIVEGRFEK